MLGKKLRIGIFVGCAFLLGTFSPRFASADSLNDFDAESGCITVSTTPSTPTQIFSYSRDAKRSLIINDSTFRLYISTKSVNMSTSTTSGDFYIPANSSWSPDGLTAPWTGKLYGVLGSTSASYTCRQRGK